MNHVSELKRRERILRSKVRSTPAAEFGVTDEDRRRTVAFLKSMQLILERHLATVPASQRPYEEYRLQFQLPLFTYLGRAYEIYYREIVGIDR